MAYTQHHSDRIWGNVSSSGNLTLHRLINGLVWTRKVGADDYLTAWEAAQVLKVHRVTMYDWVRDGLIPSKATPYGALLRWRDVRRFGKEDIRMSSGTAGRRPVSWDPSRAPCPRHGRCLARR
jgi:excisionase family DNA binding protein